MSSTTRSIVVDSVAELKISPMLEPNKIVIELTINGHLKSNRAQYNQRYVTFFEFEFGKSSTIENIGIRFCPSMLTGAMKHG